MKRVGKRFLIVFLDFSDYIMSDIEISDSDDSYHPEDDLDASDSENYSSLDSEINESDDESFISLGGGWTRVDVFADKRPDPLPPLRQSYSGVNPNLGIDSDNSVTEKVGLRCIDVAAENRAEEVNTKMS